MCVEYKVIKGMLTTYVKYQIQFSQIHENLWVYHKHKNRRKSHDQCINLYYIYFFLIPRSQHLSVRCCIIEEIIQRRTDKCFGVEVSQGLTHLGWYFTLFLSIYSSFGFLFFFVPSLTFYLARFMFFWIRKTKNGQDKTGGGEVSQVLTHLA